MEALTRQSRLYISSPHEGSAIGRGCVKTLWEGKI